MSKPTDKSGSSMIVVESSPELPNPPEHISLPSGWRDWHEASERLPAWSRVEHAPMEVPVPPATTLPVDRLPVLMKAYRGGINSTLSFDQEEAQQLRVKIRSDEQAPEEYNTGKKAVKYALLAVSEKQPLMFVGGIMAWLYLVIYLVLKVTVIV